MNEEKKNYKTLDLFGNEIIKFCKKKKTPKNLFGEEYENFVNKFKEKLTTDDCYTPPAVYQAVLNYIGKKVDLKEKEIIRPFFPNGSFEHIDYPKNCVVIDNPPFSIISKIVKFYEEKNINYFLFAPNLTLFSITKAKNYIITGCEIVYANGAKVNTSFVSNLFGDEKIIADSEFYESLNSLNSMENKRLKYKYPKNLLTVSYIFSILKKGVSFSIKSDSLYFVQHLDSQKKYGKKIFGQGFLLSEKEALKLEALKLEEEEITWNLSDREEEIIKKLK